MAKVALRRHTNTRNVALAQARKAMIDHEHDHVPHMVPYSPPGVMTRWDWYGLGFLVLICLLALLALS